MGRMFIPCGTGKIFSNRRGSLPLSFVSLDVSIGIRVMQTCNQNSCPFPAPEDESAIITWKLLNRTEEC